MGIASIEQAVERAVELRGTVMLAVRDNEHQWCAVCAAVDGTLELRVGEPAGGWRHRGRRERGQAWLRKHGFIQVIDAWAKPIDADTRPSSCGETLAHALKDGLGAASALDLVEVLVYPGRIGDVAPPAPEVSHAEHIRFALRALARTGRGKVSIEAGRPAETWAWAFVVDGALILSPETSSDDDDWTVSLAEDDVARAADQLTAVVHTQPGRDPRAPLFITFMPFKPSDPPLL